MIIDDFHIMGTIIAPHKTDAPLVVDTNAVLSRTITSQRLETIAGRAVRSSRFWAGESLGRASMVASLTWLDRRRSPAGHPASDPPARGHRSGPSGLHRGRGLSGRRSVAAGRQLVMLALHGSPPSDALRASKSAIMPICRGPSAGAGGRCRGQWAGCSLRDSLIYG